MNEVGAAPSQDLPNRLTQAHLFAFLTGVHVLQVVRVRSREARRIREPPKRFRPQQDGKGGNKPQGAAAGGKTAAA